MERPFFFVHLMKTAGFSFVLQLHRQFPPEALYPVAGVDREGSDFDAYVNVARLLQLDPARRARIRMYTGHVPFVTCDLMETPVVTLTLLRDPVDRTVSMLKHFKRGLPVAKDAPEDTRLTLRYVDMPLEAIYEDELVFTVFVENYQTKMFALDREDDIRTAFPFCEAMHYLAALGHGNDVAPPALTSSLVVDAGRLERAKAALARVDVLGLAEGYGAFLTELRARFGWWPNGVEEGARANVSNEQWDVASSFRRRIAADNAYDLDFYDYARQLIVERAR